MGQTDVKLTLTACSLVPGPLLTKQAQHAWQRPSTGVLPCACGDVYAQQLLLAVLCSSKARGTTHPCLLSLRPAAASKRS